MIMLRLSVILVIKVYDERVTAGGFQEASVSKVSP